MKMLAFATAFAGLAAVAVPAQAAYVIDITQSGADVVASGSGSLDTDDLTFQSYDNLPSRVDASSGILTLNSGYYYGYVYSGVTGPASFGSGANVQSTSSSGDADGIGVMGADEIIAPGGNYPGDPLGSFNATWSGQTLASLGLNTGTYVWSWGSGDDADSFTINIGGAAPEPSTWTLMFLGVGLAGAALRSRARIGVA
jgi:hypothetical protein